MDYSIGVKVFEGRHYLCNIALNLYLCESLSALDELIQSLTIQIM